MIYIQNIGLNKLQNKDVNILPLNNNNNSQTTTNKIQQRRQAFNEMNYEMFQKYNITQSSTMNANNTKKNNSFYTTTNNNYYNNNNNTTTRANTSFNSYTETKVQSPRQYYNNQHRNSLNPLSFSKYGNDQFSVKKSSKQGGTLRLSQMNFNSTKGQKDVMHIDDLLESYRKNQDFKNNIQSSQQQEYQNDKLDQFKSSEINFILPDQYNNNNTNINNKNLRKMSNKYNNQMQRNSISQNGDYNNKNNRNIQQYQQQNENDFYSPLNSQSQTQNINDISMQHSKTSYLARKENSISGYAIFKSTDTPMNLSTSKNDDDSLSRLSFSLQTNNHFRIQKRNNPYTRFYKNDMKRQQENNLYRYIDTQNENSPSKLNQGAFQRILDRTDNDLQSKTNDEMNIQQYYNPSKNNMQNLIDAEGKVYKKYYNLSLQSRIDYLKKLKIQNEAQMMLINYNLINEMESTNKLIYRQLPQELAIKFSNLINQVKQNIYLNAQNQKQNESIQSQQDFQSNNNNNNIQIQNSSDINNQDNNYNNIHPQQQNIERRHTPSNNQRNLQQNNNYNNSDENNYTYKLIPPNLQ